MSDYLATLFSEVQRESYRGVIGKQAYDHWTYGVLYGEGDETRPTSRPQRLRPVLAAASLLGLIGLAVFVIVQMG